MMILKEHPSILAIKTKWRKKHRISDRQMLNHGTAYRSVLTTVNEPKKQLESKMLLGGQIFSVQCVTEVWSLGLLICK